MRFYLVENVVSVMQRLEKIKYGDVYGAHFFCVINVIKEIVNKTYNIFIRDVSKHN